MNERVGGVPDETVLEWDGIVAAGVESSKRGTDADEEGG